MNDEEKIEELQEKMAEGEEEGEGFGSNEPFDPTLLERERPPLSERAAAAAQAAAEKAGAASRRVFAGIGEKLEEPGPPTDNLQDLFEGPDMEKDNDVYIKDLVEVTEEDTFGIGGANMDDILTVTEEDIMGDEDYIGPEDGSGPQLKPSPQVASRPVRREPPPTGIAGVQG